MPQIELPVGVPSRMLMASTMSQTVEYDSPWKEAIRLFLRSFLRLCFPGGCMS